jgi:hypothetical protein
VGTQAEARLHRVGEFPTEHKAAEPIHHCDQVEKAATHRNLRNIGAPDVVGSFDRDAVQQVRVNLASDPTPGVSIVLECDDDRRIDGSVPGKRVAE